MDKKARLAGRYSLASLFLVVTAIATGFVILLYTGIVAASFYATLVVIGYLSALIPVRVRYALIVLSAACSATAYLVCVPGPDMPLPTVRPPEALEIMLVPFMYVGFIPLGLIGDIFGGEFYEVIYFEDLHRVRPLVVFGFWLGIALALAVSVVVAKVRGSCEHLPLFRRTEGIQCMRQKADP